MKTKLRIDSKSSTHEALAYDDVESVIRVDNDAVAEKDSAVHLAVTGFGGVGKTAMTVQWANKEYFFEEEYDPTVEDAYHVDAKFKERDIVVDLLDTSGQEEFFAMRAVYMKRTQAFMLVYAINDKSSFERITEIVEQAKQVKGIDTFPVVVVENKIDLDDERVITKQQGLDLARSLRAPFISVSAKTGHNVFEAFDLLVKRYFEFHMSQICGWLTKRGGGTGVFGRKNWLRRWFEIDGSVLEYRKGAAASKALGSINLDEVSSVEDGRDPEDFLLVTDTRIYQLRANTAEDKEAWVQQLRNLVR